MQLSQAIELGLFFILIICIIYKLFLSVLFEAQEHNISLLILAGKEEESKEIFYFISNFYIKSIWADIYRALVFFTIYLELRNLYYDIFQKATSNLFENFDISFLFNVPAAIIWLHFFGKILRLVLNTFLLLFSISIRWLDQEKVIKIFFWLPTSWCIFLVCKYNKLAEKNILFLCHFIFNIVRLLFMIFLTLLIIKKLGIYVFLSFLFMIILIFGILFHIAKFFYTLGIKKLFYFIKINIPDVSYRDAEGNCLDPRFPFIRYSYITQQWEMKYFPDFEETEEYNYRMFFRLTLGTISKSFVGHFLIIFLFTKAIFIVL